MRPLRRLLAVLFAAAAGGGLAALAPPAALDGAAGDGAAALRALAAPGGFETPHVALVLLDETSVADPRLESTPRALMSPVWATLAETALASGAVSVGFDFIFAFDAAAFRIGEEAPLARHDDAFLQLLRREGRAGRLAIGRSAALAPARRFALMAGGASLAHVDIETEPDGVVRRVRTAFLTVEGGLAPTLSGALTGAAAAPQTLNIIPPAPLDSLPAARLADVLACAEEPGGAAALSAFFGGRVVLVGGALPGEDRFRAPDRFFPVQEAAPEAEGGPCALAPPPVRGPGGDLPGVFLHAAAADAVLSGWAPAPTAPAVDAALAALFAALAALAGLRLAPARAAAAAGGLAVLGFAGAAAALEAGVLAPAARPGLAALLGFGIGWAGRLLLLDRRARALRDSFSRYLAPSLVDRMLSQERLPALEGEPREVTVMFADLSGFTALSEKVNSGELEATVLTATVNAYLSIIAAEVERSGGYVDKFIGDAVMALWNAPVEAPDHARAAVRAAVAIRELVPAAGRRDRARNLPAFAVKIGVNAGPAIVGNVGTETRMNYTAIGDAVNLAARLEGLCSTFGTEIVLGPGVAAASAEDFDMLEIAPIRVKGRREPASVFTPLAKGSEPARIAAFAAALALWRTARFGEARAAWEALTEGAWPGAGAAAAMARFAREAEAGPPPPPDWDGAVTMTAK
ncbi:MAG: adenylate/guanylate cyclase domain-containing protein [Pikeienuella sp.]|uniref:adenylate/guanylate cyclase domain-containing protein n=1 Tax=Pikeienuella sp. TaxID=2831957 RepID=UPI00391DFEE1